MTTKYLDGAGLNHSHDRVADSQKCLNMRQHCVEDLAVTLIEEVCDPKQEYHFPFIGGAVCIYGHFVFSAKVDRNPSRTTEDTTVFNCMVYRILSV